MWHTVLDFHLAIGRRGGQGVANEVPALGLANLSVCGLVKRVSLGDCFCGDSNGSSRGVAKQPHRKPFAFACAVLRKAKRAAASRAGEDLAGRERRRAVAG